MVISAARLALGAAVAGLAAVALLFALPHSAVSHSRSALAADRDFSRAPLAFEPNAGRGPAGDDFYARARGATVALTSHGARLSLPGGNTLASRLVGTGAGRRAQPEHQLPTRVNSFVGSSPSQWRTGLRTYGQIRYASVYPGIDLIYHGRQRALEYDFLVQPRADASRIALSLSGARSLRIDARGSLVATVGKRQIRELRPVAYQSIGGKRVPVDASFALQGNRVSFRLGSYDHSRALTIDPVVAFADYASSSGTDFAYDIAADSSGNVYVGGETSGSIPGGSVKEGTSGPGGYLMKVAPDGARQWITYLSGRVTDVVVGPGGTPYVTGATGDGLAAKNADDSTFGGGGLDAFAGRFNTDGTRKWLTYFGGAGAENNTQSIGGIAVDAGGNAYITGTTTSSGLAKGTSIWDPGVDANGDAFVAKYGPGGSRLLTTYFGGSGTDIGYGIGVQPSCSSDCAVYIGGYTNSGDFPVLNAAEPSLEGSSDAFAARINSGFTGRDWATYYGGVNDDTAYSLAVDPSGNPTIVGYSYNICCSSTGQAFVRTYYGPSGTYVFNKSFGGSQEDIARDVATDAQGNIYVIGSTQSSDFPISGAIQPTQAGAGDAFVIKFNRGDPASFSGDTVWSTYLGGGAFDNGDGIGTGPHGDVYISGDTGSNDFPVTSNASQSFNNPYDGWFARLEMKRVEITDGPEGTLRSHDATFTYKAHEPSATYNCRLSPVETDFSSCPVTGKTYTGLADGDYTFEVSMNDSSKTTGRTTERQFTVDTRPQAVLAIAPNPALVGSTVTFDASGSSGANGQELTKFEWDIDGDGNFERDTGANSKTTEIFASPRENPVSVRVTDASGAVATATTTMRISKPPSGIRFGVTINKGAQYTRSPDVTVSASFPSSTTSMLFSNDGGFLDPTTFTPQPTVKWKLDSSGPERLPKTIYVRFLAGTIPSETFQDDIILDETPPKVDQAAVTPAVPAAASVARAAAAKRKWKVKVKAHDSNSGVKGIQVTSNKRKPGKLLRYKRKLTVKSAKRPKWIRARDRAGNYSKWRKAK